MFPEVLLTGMVQLLEVFESYLETRRGERGSCVERSLPNYFGFRYLHSVR